MKVLSARTLSEIERIEEFLMGVMFSVVLEIRQMTENKKYYKGERDIVTQADILSTKMLYEAIQQKYPHFGIISEEKRGIVNPEATWRAIIDPVDGTTNLAYGLGGSTISIGVLYEDDPLLGLVLSIGGGYLYTAIKGQGAFLNGERIRVSDARTIAGQITSIGAPAAYPRRDAMGKLYDRLGSVAKAQDVKRWGSATSDSGLVACGKSVLYTEPSLSLWDWAAGGLIATESGGKVTTMWGKPIDLTGPAKSVDLLVTNGWVHEEALELIHNCFAGGFVTKGLRLFTSFFQRAA